MAILDFLSSRPRPETASNPLLGLASSFLLLLLQATHAEAQTCMPQPISLPIQNVTLATGASQRGVFLTAGQPAQNFAFLPSLHNNNTFLFDVQCNGLGIVSTLDACTTFRGGLYHPADSSTTADVPVKFDPPPEPFAFSSYIFMSDTFHVASNINFRDYVFAIPRNSMSWGLKAFDAQHLLGLDKGSIFISALLDNKYLASSTFGYWWGLDGVQSIDQQNGALVLGGYDKAKTVGDGTTIPMSKNSNCPSNMLVTIKDITMNKANGVDQSIFNNAPSGNPTLQACIQPEKPVLMDMPQDVYFDNLLSIINNDGVTRSNGIDYQNVILDKSKALYAGGMTFTIDGGLTIKIPNHQLIVPERIIGSNGVINTNATHPLIRINAIENSSNVMPVLGRYFFTSAYLMSNPTAGNFKLWQAKPTASTSLVAVGDDGKEVDNSKFCKPGESWDPSPSPGSSSPENPPVSTKIAPGAIAGAAVGGAAGLIGIAGLVWFLIRRRRRNVAYKQAENGPMETQQSAAGAKPYSELEIQQGPKPFSEMESPHQGVLTPPQEMAANENGSTPVEMP